VQFVLSECHLSYSAARHAIRKFSRFSDCWHSGMIHTLHTHRFICIHTWDDAHYDVAKSCRLHHSSLSMKGSKHLYRFEKMYQVEKISPGITGTGPRLLFNSFCREGRSDLQSQFLMRVNLVVCGKALILGFGRTPLTFKWHGRELMLKGTVTSYTRTHSIYIHIYIYRAPWHPTLEPILYVYIYLYIYIYIYTGYRDILH